MALASLKRCPLCDSANIAKLRGNLTRQHEGRTYTIPDVTYYECPDCGERIFDPDAMDAIEACSPAFKKTGRQHKKPSASSRKMPLGAKRQNAPRRQPLARTQ